MNQEMPESIFQGLNTEPATEYKETREATKKNLEPYVVKNAEIERLLAEINFEEINRLTSSDFQKSGGAVELGKEAKAHTISPEDIICVSPEGATHIGMPADTVMAYMPTARVIVINHAQLQEMRTAFPGAPFALVFLKLLMHEENHVAGSLTASEYPGDVMVIQSGMVRQALYPDGRVDARYDFWNEAINERRSIELTRQYLESNPLATVTRGHLEFLNPKNSKISVAEYLVGMKLVDEIIKKIQKTTRVSEEKIWESLVHASMQGLNLDSPEARRLIDFTSIFGPQFVKDLRALDMNPKTLTTFVKKYKLGKPGEYAQIVASRLAIRNTVETTLDAALSHLHRGGSAPPVLPGLPGSTPPTLPGLPSSGRPPKDTK